MTGWVVEPQQLKDRGDQRQAARGGDSCWAIAAKRRAGGNLASYGENVGQRLVEIAHPLPQLCNAKYTKLQSECKPCGAPAARSRIAWYAIPAQFRSDMPLKALIDIVAGQQKLPVKQFYDKTNSGNARCHESPGRSLGEAGWSHPRVAGSARPEIEAIGRRHRALGCVRLATGTRPGLELYREPDPDCRGARHWRQ